jgi:hypothetical protein
MPFEKQIDGVLNDSIQGFQAKDEEEARGLGFSFDSIPSL